MYSVSVLVCIPVVEWGSSSQCWRASSACVSQGAQDLSPSLSAPDTHTFHKLMDYHSEHC